MKPPPLDYLAADSVEHAVSALREGGDEAKLLAGGQSLLPLLNLRLARPSLLIDVNRVSRMSDIVVTEEHVRFGALVRHRRLETSTAVGRTLPLLTEAAGWIAHPQIRTRGTIGGALAHSDAAAELPAVLLALDAAVTVRSVDRTRTVPVADLAVTHLVSSLDDDEMITAVEVPLPPAGSGTAFCEFARRHGDYAIGGAACVLTLDPGRSCVRARLVVMGGAQTSVRAVEAEQMLLGTTLSAAEVQAAAEIAVRDLAPVASLHGDSEYRRDVIRTMAARAIHRAAERAGATS